MQAIARSGKECIKVVIGSTAAVYGAGVSSDLLLMESDDCDPTDDYGCTKLEAERIAIDAAERSQIPFAVARIFNAVGSGQDERHVAGRVAAQLVACKRDESHVLELGQLSSIRDFIDVRDVARALARIAVAGNGIVNVASGRGCKIETLVQEFADVSGLDIRPSVNPEIRAGVGRSVADVGRLAALGFVPQYTLRESIQDLWSYYNGLWAKLVR
jgi:nucleoside-diphosphate-sugar epimerase